jgi:acyl phosphate:glycerol-3-phosphate acyltransferase
MLHTPFLYPLSIATPVPSALPLADSSAPWLVAAIYGVCALFAYLIGSFPTGYIVVKQMTGEDIRLIGSGGTGATNVRRVAGKKAALIVLFIDFHKGLIPVILTKMAFPGMTPLHVLAGLLAVIGHSKSIFLGFKGGKSAATGLGALMGMSPLVAVALGVIAFGVTRLTRFQSVGSITAGICAPILMVLLHQPVPYTLYTVLAALYVIFLHRANIQRLIQGTENPL